MNTVGEFVECDFAAFLTRTLALDPTARPQCGSWSRLGSTIGALALRLGLMSEADVDTILDVQDTEGGYFGEIAVRQGCLTPAQVSSLLDIQQLHDDLNLGEQLVAAGKLDVPSLINMLVQFSRENAGLVPHTDRAAPSD